MNSPAPYEEVIRIADEILEWKKQNFPKEMFSIKDLSKHFVSTNASWQMCDLLIRGLLRLTSLDVLQVAWKVEYPDGTCSQETFYSQVAPSLEEVREKLKNSTIQNKDLLPVYYEAKNEQL